jgi:hypothetical protein
MSALFGRRMDYPCEMKLRIFAPPADGMNDLSVPDGVMNSYTTVEKLPKLRIAYAPVEADRD